jgi:hypothetical protein
MRLGWVISAKNIGFLHFFKSAALYLYLGGAYLLLALFSDLDAILYQERYLAFFFGFMAARIVVSLKECHHAFSCHSKLVLPANLPSHRLRDGDVRHLWIGTHLRQKYADDAHSQLRLQAQCVRDQCL